MSSARAWHVLYLDGVHFSIRHCDRADSTIILTALGVHLAGNNELLALRAYAEEDKDGWSCLLQDLRSRGATHIDLIVTDGHNGLLAAVSQLFATTLRQRCLVHKQRNVESLFSNVWQRTDQIDVFTTETSLTIVWATIQDIRLHKISL